MRRSDVPAEACTPGLLSGRLSRTGSWLLVAVCGGLLAVYVALHTRELLLIIEWLTPG